MNKVPFDVLEVGCKYESRCGEVWEVIFYDKVGTGFDYVAQCSEGVQVNPHRVWTCRSP